MEKPNGVAVIKARTARNQKKVDALLKKNYSIRQIQRELHFKSVSSVYHYLPGRKTK